MQLIPRKKSDVPTREAIELQNQGLDNPNIVQSLKSRNYSNDQISDALNQASIKQELNETEEIPLALRYAPSPSDYQPSRSPGYVPYQDSLMSQTPSPQQDLFQAKQSPNFENIQEIAEEIIKEKWDELTRDLGDLKLWKERMDIDLSGVKQELIRTQNKFETIQKAMLGKVSDYDSTMRDVSSEMKALNQVFEKIIGPLTKNVKELSEISDKMHHRKK